MRKIEKEMIQAMGEDRIWSKDNTAVCFNEDGYMYITLFGNTIAFETSQGWYITVAGWNTVTTRSRLNALATAIGSPLYKGVSSRQGQLYIHWGQSISPMGDSDIWPILG